VKHYLRYKSWFALTALVVIALLAGCGPTPTPQVIKETVVVEKEKVVEKTVEVVVTPTAAPAPAAPAGPPGTLRIALRETLLSLDPQKEFQIVSLGFTNKAFADSLVQYDDEYNFVPGLAVSWRAVDDLTWEFKLREGVKFHNGEPFNAEAVKHSFERLVDPDYKAGSAFLLGGVESVEVTDEYTVLVQTKEPFGALLPNLTLVSIVPVEASQRDDFATNPVGTGPFRFVEWKKGEKLVMEANPDYWGGPPKLEQVIYYPIAEDATRMAAVRTGEVDIAYGVPPEEISSREAEPHLEVFKTLSNDNVCIRTYLEGEAPPTDPKIRKAILMAIDREAIVNEILQGVGAVAKSVISSALPVFNPNLEPYPYDPEQAKALLAEAGYPDGFSANIVVPSGFYPKDAEITQAIAAYLQQIGVSLEVRLVEQSSAWPLRRVPYDFFYAGNAVMNMDGDMAFYRDYMPETSREKYNNPEVVRLLNAARSSVDQDERRELYRQVQAAIWEDLPNIPIHDVGDVWAVSKRVKNWQPRPDKTIILKDASVED
jgi:peptide/nickel transport system substrate-binding protein